MPGPEQKSTDVPQPPAVSSIFRESFVAFFEQPEQEAALRLLAELARGIIGEGRDHFLRVDSPLDTITRQSSRGAVGDLRQAANELAEVARDLDDANDREGTRMLLAIADAAAEVEPIAARLDAMLARYLVASAEVRDDD
jgi:hypothetical protein